MHMSMYGSYLITVNPRVSGLIRGEVKRIKQQSGLMTQKVALKDKQT
jgi:hypothetical protein